MATDPVTRCLAPGERILWRREPPVDAQIGVRIFGLVFVSLFGVGGLAMLAMATGVLHADTTHGDMMVAWIVGVVFTLIGVTGFVHGVFDLVASRSTHYVLTNRRVMILTGPRSQSFRRAAFEPHEVANGAILFAHGPMGKRGTGFQQRLVGLDNAGHVALQIMGALPPSTPTSAPPALEQRKIRPDFGGDRVAAHLLPGERIVWRQDAPPLILAGRKLLFLPLFAIVSVGAIMPARQLIQAPHPDLGLIAVPALFCVIFGGFSLIGSALLILDIFEGWSTTYALTDQRLLITTSNLVTLYPSAAFAQIERTGRDDRGTIAFNAVADDRDGRMEGRLVGVDDPIRVETLIVTTLAP